MNQALLRGELDARVNVVPSLLRRNPEWIEKNSLTFTSSGARSEALDEDLIVAFAEKNLLRSQRTVT
jgi:hypothetical protein